jgi:hypothetical protein
MQTGYSYCVITALSPHPEELGAAKRLRTMLRIALRRTRPGIRFGASWFETALTRLLTMRDD